MCDRGTPLRNRRNNRARAHSARLALIACLAPLGGCADYLDRRDTVSPGAGDAIASLRAEQMVDPWPATSANRDIPGNGVLAAAAARRYETDTVKRPHGVSTRSDVTISGDSSPVAPPPASPPATPSPAAAAVPAAGAAE